MSIASKLLSKGFTESSRIFGEKFTFRGLEIVGVPTYKVTETDVLKFEQGELCDNILKLEVQSKYFQTDPVIGEYIYNGTHRYEIISCDFHGEPTNTFILLCHGGNT